MFCSFVVDPQWDTADAEIKVSFAENPERVLPVKPGVGQNIDMRTSSIARNFFLIPLQVQVYSNSFPNLSLCFFLLLGLGVVSIGSSVGLSPDVILCG